MNIHFGVKNKQTKKIQDVFTFEKHKQCISAVSFCVRHIKTQKYLIYSLHRERKSANFHI